MRINEAPVSSNLYIKECLNIYYLFYSTSLLSILLIPSIFTYSYTIYLSLYLSILNMFEFLYIYLECLNVNTISSIQIIFVMLVVIFLSFLNVFLIIRIIIISIMSGPCLAIYVYES